MLRLVEPNAKRERPRTAEEMLSDLFWARYWNGDSARLLMLHPDGDVSTEIDDTDLTPWQNKWEQDGALSVLKWQAPLPPEDWKPPADSVVRIAGMIKQGCIPVGVIVPDYDECKQLRPRFYPSGYLPTVEAQRILFAFALGFKTGSGKCD